MFGSRWTQKPPVGTQIDWSHSFAAGLQAFWALNEGTGLVSTDLVQNIQATQAGGASWSAGQFATGVFCNASNARAQATWPSGLDLAWPITIASAFTLAGTNSGSGWIFGIFPGPISCYLSSGTTPTVWVNNGSALSSGKTISSGSTHVVAVTISSSNVSIYLDGALAASTTNSGAANWGSNNVAFGDSSSYGGRTSGLLYYWGGIWTSALPAAVHAGIGANPNAIWQVCRPQRGVMQSYVPRGGLSYPRGSTSLTPADRRPTGSWISKLYG
jgi:hypothetical protein